MLFGYFLPFGKCCGPSFPLTQGWFVPSLTEIRENDVTFYLNNLETPLHKNDLC